MVQLMLTKIHTCWKPVLVGAVALVLMLPLPAFAFDWLNDWNITQRQTGGAPGAASITAYDTDSGGNLTVDMGSFAFPAQFSSSVTATRNFEASGSEILDLLESFQTFQHATNLAVTVKLTPMSFGHSSSFPAVNVVNRGGPATFLDYSNESQKNINDDGRYRITISIKYTKNRFSPRGVYADVSPFSFTFTGI